MAIDHTLLKSRLDGLEFRFAPDHSGGYAFDTSSASPKCARPNTLNDVRLQWLGLAFHSERRLLLHIEDTAYQFIRVVRNEDVAPMRRVDQPAGGIDCIAHGSEFALRANRAQQNLPTVNPHFQADGKRPYAFLECFLHLERGTYGTFCIVFACGFCSPERHDRVTDVFINMTAIFLDNAVCPYPETVDKVRHIFRVPVFGERSKAGDIRK